MPKLFLVPNTINEAESRLVPVYISGQIKNVRLFFVEEPKSARRLLKSLDPEFPLNECRFLPLNEHSAGHEIKACLKLLMEEDGAIISEAGCPCVADPGADLVLDAHQNNIEIIPLAGPSSLVMALMASGLSGQNFAFNGYLPKDRQERIKKIKTLEERSSKEDQTQMFMETPYRNQSIFNDILDTCQSHTRLCVAYDIAGNTQQIKTMTIKSWRGASVQWDKKPALFLIHSPKNM